MRLDRASLRILNKNPVVCLIDGTKTQTRKGPACFFVPWADLIVQLCPFNWLQRVQRSLRKRSDSSDCEGIERQIVNENERKLRSQIGRQVRGKRFTRQELSNRGRVYDKAGILVPNVF